MVERDPDTGLFVGYIPGWAGAHSQGATLDELRENLREVVAMLLEDGDPRLEAEFIGNAVDYCLNRCRVCRFSNLGRWFGRWSASVLSRFANGAHTASSAIPMEEVQRKRLTIPTQRTTKIMSLARIRLWSLAPCGTPDPSARQSAEGQAPGPADRPISNRQRTRGCR